MLLHGKMIEICIDIVQCVPYNCLIDKENLPVVFYVTFGNMTQFSGTLLLRHKSQMADLLK